MMDISIISKLGSGSVAAGEIAAAGRSWREANEEQKTAKKYFFFAFGNIKLLVADKTFEVASAPVPNHFYDANNFFYVCAARRQVGTKIIHASQKLHSCHKFWICISFKVAHFKSKGSLGSVK